jgi:hypothetical protein
MRQKYYCSRVRQRGTLESVTDQEAANLRESAPGGTRPLPDLQTRRRLIGRAAALLVVVLALVVVTAHVLVARGDGRSASVLWAAEMPFALLVNLSLLLLAYALGRRLCPPLASLRGDPLADGLAAVGLGFGALSLSILALGLLHLLYWPLFAALGLACTVVLRTEITDAWRLLLGAAARFGAARRQRSLPPEQRVLVALLALLLLTCCLRASVPLLGDAQDFDGVSYHVVAAKLYLAAHQIIPLPDVSLANAPAAADLFAVVGLMLHTDLQLKVLHLCFGLLLAAALGSFTRRHLRPDAALPAVVLLFSPIWIVDIMSGTLVDFPPTFLAVVALSDLAAWLEAPLGPPCQSRTQLRLLGPGRPGDGLLIRGGLLAGLAVSCKLTAAPLLPAAIAALGLTCLFAGGTPARRRLARATRACCLTGAASILPLLPWFAKNLAFFGNPIYPMGQLVNGGDCTGAQGVCASISTGAPGRLPPLLAGGWHMLVNVWQIYWDYTGPLCLLLLLAPFLLRRRIAARFTLLFLLLGALLWWKFVPLFSPPRYWLSMLAIAFCLSAAAAMELIAQAGPLRRPAMAALSIWLLGGMLWSLTLSVGLVQRSDALPLIGGRLSPNAFLTQRVRPYRAMDWVNLHTPPQTEVATVNMVLGYYLERPHLSDWFGTRLSRLQAGGTAEANELRAWCRAGVRVIVFNRGLHEYNDDVAAKIRPRARFAWLSASRLQARLLFSWRGVDVLSVQPCAAARGAIASGHPAAPSAASG